MSKISSFSVFLASAVIAFSAVPAHSGARESALAKMIAAAKQCGVKINDEAVVTYIKTNELVPESFYSLYKSASSGILKDENPDCQIAKLSAQSAGLVE
jgi:hypothetical protein